MSISRGTYLIHFGDGTRIVCGNNYKPWYTHASEYAMSKFRKGNEAMAVVESVRFSDTPFVDDGGLKWATPQAYQEVIDEETKKDGKARPDFKDIVFYFSNRDKKKLEKELRYWLS